MADDLHRQLEGRPILSRRIGLLGRGWRWCRRNPGLAAASLSAAALLAMLVVGAVASAMIDRARRIRIADDLVRIHDPRPRPAQSATGPSPPRPGPTGARTEMRAVLDFLQNRVLAAARPEGPGGRPGSRCHAPRGDRHGRRGDRGDPSRPARRRGLDPDDPGRDLLLPRRARGGARPDRPGRRAATPGPGPRPPRHVDRHRQPGALLHGPRPGRGGDRPAHRVPRAGRPRSVPTTRRRSPRRTTSPSSTSPPAGSGTPCLFMRRRCGSVGRSSGPITPTR